MPILHLFVYTVVIKIGAKNVQNVVHTIKKKFNSERYGKNSNKFFLRIYSLSTVKIVKLKIQDVHC